MAWNEPGGGRDPWGGGGGDQGPPDLDQVIRNLQTKLGGIFGRGGAGGGRPGGGPGPAAIGGRGLALVAAVLVAIWAVAGFYIVDPAEEGVVTRFGKFVRTEGAGPHWLPYFIERVEKVNVQQVRTAEIGFRSSGRGQGVVGSESLMLTQDENIIDVKFAIQYRVKDAAQYLFSANDPDRLLRDVTESSVRETVGRSTMDFVITEGRSAVSASVQDLSQQILDHYAVGLVVTSVNMQDAQPPAQVQESFYDAVKAREDEVRFRNEAEAYANEILPKARGDADAAREQASAYRSRVVSVAEGETSRFSSVLQEYRKAPEVTRDRMYLDAMEEVLSNSSKILLEAQGSNNLLYLPVDKLIEGRRAGSTGAVDSDAAARAAAAAVASEAARRSREELRRRDR
jgi:membrane protease subunit HflK